MSSVCMLLFLLFLWFVTSPAFISGHQLQPPNGSTGRSLLQIKKECSEDFENKDYTVITSKCKGPRYSKEDCCGALKTFACPYADLLNDEKTKCATTMFSYITLIGNYPAGLFANICKEDKQGLVCPDNSTAQIESQKNGSLDTVSINHPSASVVACLSVSILIIHWFQILF